MRLENFKRGDTFFFSADIDDGYGNPLSLDIGSIRSQIRNSRDELISELDVSVGDVAGRYIFKDSNTQGWSLGELYMDIEVTQDEIVTSSPTIVIPVVRDITKNE